MKRSVKEFRKSCRTEMVAKWWLPYTLYYADWQRNGTLNVWCDGCLIAKSQYITLEGASTWAMMNGYCRLGDAP